MSHFVQCDRCDTKEHVMGTVSLPPGWQKILQHDLCEPCCMMIRDFIRFKPGDAAKLPVEPIPAEPAPEPSTTGEKLFETAPQVSADSPAVSGHASNGKPVPNEATDGDPIGKTQPVSAEFKPSAEASTEERKRTRKPKAMRGQDAILPDVRKPEPPTPGAQP